VNCYSVSNMIFFSFLLFVLLFFSSKIIYVNFFFNIELIKNLAL
jgi:hypothetical protein